MKDGAASALLLSFHQVRLGTSAYEEMGDNTAKSRRLKIHFSCLLSWIPVWKKACMDNLLFPR